jgi:hypothetical protein
LAILAVAEELPLDIGREPGGVASAAEFGFGEGCSENARKIAGTGVGEVRAVVVELGIDAIGKQRLGEYVDAERVRFGGPGPGLVGVAAGMSFVVSVHCWPKFVLQLLQDSESSSQLAAAV